MGSEVEHYEGWLFVIRSHRVRKKSLHKRYFTLDNGTASYFKRIPEADELPLKTGQLHRAIYVEDYGREILHGRAYYLFKLRHPSDHVHEMELGADSAETAAEWMNAFRQHIQHARQSDEHTPFKPDQGKSTSTITRQIMQAASRKKSAEYMLDEKIQRHKSKLGSVSNVSGDDEERGDAVRGSSPSSDLKCGVSVPQSPTTAGKSSSSPAVLLTDWTASVRSPTDDVLSHPNWIIINCTNGMRIFKETNEVSKSKHDPKTLMAVTVVPASCELVFDTVMALGTSRAQWDYVLQRCRLIEHIDGHTDIVYKAINSDLVPWCTKPRDLVLTRYWRREEDGSFVVLYSSTSHKDIPPQQGYTRANIASGGYIITPLGSNEGKDARPRCVVRHMMEVDWTGFIRRRPKVAQAVTCHLLYRLAALREMFAVNDELERSPPALAVRKEDEESLGPTGTRVRTQPIPANSLSIRRLQTPRTPRGSEVPATEASNDSHKENGVLSESVTSGFLETEGQDEFFDVPEEAPWHVASADHPTESLQHESEVEGLPYNQGDTATRLSATALVKRFQDLATAARKKRRESNEEEALLAEQHGSLEEGPQMSPKCCWSNPDSDIFLIRGKKYLQDGRKVSAAEPQLQLVAVDWFKSNKREDHLACRQGTVVQKGLGTSNKPFFLIINLQVPGSTTYSLALYYALQRPLEDIPLLQRFVDGDDAHRNQRFKLIPHIAEGNWIVKQSVGKTACLIGEALHINYFKGPNYLELDVDVGSSSIAKGVVGLVISYVEKLIVDLAFLVQANSEDELPEELLGTVEICHLSLSKAVAPPPAP